MNIYNKSKWIFMQSDIEKFYPSISEGFWMKAVDHAK